MTIPANAIIAVIKNTPDKPNEVAIIGPNTRATAKLIPIHIPITAITFGLCSSRVTSDAKAKTALAIAPIP